jgi:hypothetical protein
MSATTAEVIKRSVGGDRIGRKADEALNVRAHQEQQTVYEEFEVLPIDHLLDQYEHLIPCSPSVLQALRNGTAPVIPPERIAERVKAYLEAPKEYEPVFDEKKDGIVWRRIAGEHG